MFDSSPESVNYISFSKIITITLHVYNESITSYFPAFVFKQRHHRTKINCFQSSL